MKKILYTAICACSILCGAQAQTPGSEVPNLKKLYELTDSCDVNVRARFSPLIGISASISNGASRVGATYIQSIVKAGGTPVIIPAVTDGKVLRNIVSNLDGLVLIGGADVNPLWYEEEPREKLEEVDPVRDLYELKLIKMATDQNIPLLVYPRRIESGHLQPLPHQTVTNNRISEYQQRSHLGRPGCKRYDDTHHQRAHADYQL